MCAKQLTRLFATQFVDAVAGLAGGADGEVGAVVAIVVADRCYRKAKHARRIVVGHRHQAFAGQAVEDGHQTGALAVVAANQDIVDAVVRVVSGGGEGRAEPCAGLWWQQLTDDGAIGARAHPDSAFVLKTQRR